MLFLVHLDICLKILNIHKLDYSFHIHQYMIIFQHLLNINIFLYELKNIFDCLYNKLIK